MKRNERVEVMLTPIEKKAIQAKARITGAKISTFMRELALQGKADKSKRPLPREVLRLIGELTQVAATLNQIAKKRQNEEELNAIERITLQQVAADVHQLSKDIKSYII